MYINRTVEDAILAAGKSFPCEVVYGPRQVGKCSGTSYFIPGGNQMNTIETIQNRISVRQFLDQELSDEALKIHSGSGHERPFLCQCPGLVVPCGAE